MREMWDKEEGKEEKEVVLKGADEKACNICPYFLNYEGE